MKTFNDLREEQKREDQHLFIALELVGTIMAVRDRKRLSQRELSRLSGVPQKTISRIENGIDIPKISTLIKLINALNLELSIVDKDSKKEQSATLQ
ncbi:helix-turn-helix domain-containing protein [Bacillus inaquosorum]|uniref:helix-turn-helix domain-containing protein n=2 Tax=Bacillus inaquosorum TaxID=483913 RepID=UPI002280528D|nr:helix-turn-helix transcriptional regulator [Bacillus inaquosorum]MCY8279748.1 helix-turn-helix domain-containing protein [Bacillus inaquosorum]